jgi:trehalose 6-phosphate phosphatase
MAAGALGAALARLGDDPGRLGVFTDFDGTLSEIVADPAAAAPLPGAIDALVALAGRVARVGVISGRPVEFLQAQFPPQLVLAGLYGLETVIGGHRSDHPDGAAWRPVVADVAARSRAQGPAGMLVESKGLSITLHYRVRPELEADVRAWAEEQASQSGLEVRPARMSVELHPPVRVDKGTTLLELAEGLDAVCFLGDDHGDLAAFDALDRLAGARVATLRVGVQSAEGAVELLERADLVVDGPAGALQVIRAIAVG